MEEDSPKEQQKLGRKVHNFDKAKWNTVARTIVYRGNIAKFIQNPKLGEMLVATKGTTLVEASPIDTIWGIGLAEDNPLVKDRQTWKGLNWLGETLTKVRDDIMSGLIGECRYCENISSCQNFSELQKIKGQLINVQDCLTFSDILLKLC